MTTQLVEKRLTPELMIQDLDTFMTKIESLASLLKLDLSFAQADHIALRINDTETAKAAHEAWCQYGKVISQAKINGRPIIVIAFDNALESRGWKIECLELPYPAEGKIYPTESWEHVEFVIPSHAETANEFLIDLKHTYPEFGARFDALAGLGVKVKLSSPKGEGERLSNPTVAFKYQGVCIKLHPHSLKRIVESEQDET
ncbi:VOC family protein [Vibrio sp. AND4]|uniref:VOC family protein n=1 Tax=Vibrio sp. AND4 TaxID=314289 RepID=UPI00015F0600|nr:VOC family protein [Vibrio sp. AND4]EDP58424.1 hypothetical protein AND4_04650 [Vibrio sp. AND4]